MGIAAMGIEESVTNSNQGTERLVMGGSRNVICRNKADKGSR